VVHLESITTVDMSALKNYSQCVTEAANPEIVQQFEAILNTWCHQIEQACHIQNIKLIPSILNGHKPLIPQFVLV
jgi:hypothetical protein